jgi:uncharacterized protein DUF4249
VATTACALADITPPPGEEQVVVQGVLHAQLPQQVLWIDRSTVAGEPLAYDPRPLESPPARVEVRDDLGTVFRFVADTGDATRFIADFTPVPGRRYELLVEAGGRTVRGSTVVPGQITIVEPAADTVPDTRPLRVSWASGASRHVAVYLTPDTVGDAFDYAFPFLVRDDTTVVADTLFGGFFFQRGTVVSVVAVDSVTARLFRPPSAERGFDGNLTGGAGAFGAVTRDRVFVRAP